MMCDCQVLFVGSIWLITLSSVACKVARGILTTQDDWHFLERFCFVSDDGKLDYSFSYPVSYAVQNMYLYFDSPEQWPSVYKTNKTCLQKEAVLHRDMFQIVNLSTWTFDSYSSPGCEIRSRDGEKWLSCKGYRRFSSARERWWYIAVGNCNASKGLYLQYHLTMTNGEEGNIWFYHFSADEFFILPVTIAFLLGELFLFTTACVVASILRARQLLHTSYKQFMAAVFLEILCLFFRSIAYGDYANNGVGLPMVKLLGQMFRAMSHLVFLLDLIIVAKGVNVTRGRLSKKGSIKIVVFITLYSVAYASVFVYEARMFDPGKVLYIYESPAGYALIVLRLIGWVWFCYAIYLTLVHYPEKRRFYVSFASAYTLWFWMGPVCVVVASRAIGKWMREKIVTGIDDTIAFLGFISFLMITWPSVANKNFPYHVRTGQIDVLNAKADGNESTSLPHNTYEPSATSHRSYDIFTVNGRCEPGSELSQPQSVAANFARSQLTSGGSGDSVSTFSSAKPFLSTPTRAKRHSVTNATIENEDAEEL